MQPERIEGKFYYAERHVQGSERGACIFRVGTPERIDYIPGRGFPNIEVTTRLKQLDAQARHFIDSTKAQYAELINAAKGMLECKGTMQRIPLTADRLAAALKALEGEGETP